MRARDSGRIRGIAGFLLALSVAVSAGGPVFAVIVPGEHTVPGPPPLESPRMAGALGTRGGGNETGFEVGRYELNVDIDPQNHTLNGTVTIDFTATTILDTVALHLFPELTVRRARDGTGTSLTWQRGDFGMILVTLSSSLCAGCSGTLVIDFSGAIGQDNVELYNYIGLEGVYLQDYILQDVPYNGSWLPWNGVAPETLNITVPAGFVALAQGRLEDMVRTGTKDVYSWVVDRPWLAESNLVVANRFEEFEAGLPGSNVTLDLLGKDSGQAANLVALIRDSLSFFSARFGDVPCEELRVAETTMLAPAAQGGFCLVTFHESVLGGDPMPANLVLPHEISHQWWGAGIRFTGPGSGFLSEGIAQYSEYLYNRSASGSDNLIRVANANAVGLARGEFGKEIPIANTTVDGTTRSEVTRYDKGAMVLHMLRYLLGDDAFFALLRTFAATHALSNATLGDFETAATVAAGTDLSEFFRQWVHSVDALDFEIAGVSSEKTSGGYQTQITLRRIGQTRMPVDVELRYANGSVKLMVKAWDGLADSTVLTVSSATEVTGIELDPHYWLLDFDRENNVWPHGATPGLLTLLVPLVAVAIVALVLVAFLLLRRRKRAKATPQTVDNR